MASGWRRRRPGWEWWCDDHPGAGRQVVEEAIARRELREHLQAEHPEMLED